MSDCDHTYRYHKDAGEWVCENCGDRLKAFAGCGHPRTEKNTTKSNQCKFCMKCRSIRLTIDALIERNRRPLTIVQRYMGMV